MQLALNVPDLDEAVDYYIRLFGVAPHKRRPGYANFVVGAPPLKLVLFENADADAHLHHIGVEMMDPGEVETVQRRLDRLGLLDEVEGETECCHAVQEKIWSRAPNGLRWEWYRIIDDDPHPQSTQDETCCAEEDAAGGGKRLLGRLRARRWKQRLDQQRLGQT